MINTPISYLEAGHGQTKNGYLWITRSSENGGVYYHWATSRAQDELIQLLNLVDPKATSKKYHLQCDGYSAYNAVAKRFKSIKLGACLAHIRRKFLPLNGATSPEWVEQLLKRIQKLYAIERTLRYQNAPPDRRKQIRQQESFPICEAIKQQLDDQVLKQRPQSQLGKAVNYALGQWTQWISYLEDGRMEIDNNGAENAIRPTKLGAKNWLFFGNAKAGHQSAAIYTILQNCKTHGLNPRNYLEYVFEALKTQPAEELTPAKVVEVLRMQNDADKAA